MDTQSNLALYAIGVTCLVSVCLLNRKQINEDFQRVFKGRDSEKPISGSTVEKQRFTKTPPSSRRSSLASFIPFLSKDKKDTPKSVYSKNSVDEVVPDPSPLNITPDMVETYEDRPWRPFRWPYHQTMSTFKLDVNHWLDMDKWYIHYIKEKARIYHEFGDENIGWLPEGYEASEELMDTVVNHLLKRYPLLFKKTENGIHNLITDEKLDLSRPLKDHPLIYVSKLAKEDFYVVLKKDDGRHYLVAAEVPFPGGSFGIKHKLGKHLDIIHAEVPYYQEKLKKSMERWFARMKAQDIVERASWYISWDKLLLCNNVYSLKPGEKVDPNVEYKDFNVRVERQTLRRLPKTQAIIFTNHPVFYSLEEMKDEPLVPSLIKKVINEGPELIRKYKNFDCFVDHLNPYLDKLIQRQYDKNIITPETPVRTLNTYPFAHWVKSNHDEMTGWLNPAMGKDADEALCPAGFS